VRTEKMNLTGLDGSFSRVKTLKTCGFKTKFRKELIVVG